MKLSFFIWKGSLAPTSAILLSIFLTLLCMESTWWWNIKLYVKSTQGVQMHFIIKWLFIAMHKMSNISLKCKGAVWSVQFNFGLMIAAVGFMCLLWGDDKKIFFLFKNYLILFNINLNFYKKNVLQLTTIAHSIMSLTNKLLSNFINNLMSQLFFINWIGSESAVNSPYFIRFSFSYCLMMNQQALSSLNE